jgi:asparagine synthase (glutamine-hydrolysing)
LDVIPAISTVYDEPFSDSSQIPSILVANLAKNHVSVCLSGDGGDELFLGYNRYTASAQAWHSFRYLPRAFRTAAGAALQRINTDHWDRLYSLVNRTLLSGRHPQSNVGLKVRKLGQTLKQKTLRDAYKLLLRYCENSDGLTCYHSVFRDPLDDLDVLSNGILGNPALFPLQAQYWDQLSYLPDDNLVKVDRSTMAVSLESRLPLLDPRIIQSSWRMPIDMKMHGGVGKWPLRDILYRHVPKHLLDRPKMGFSVPVRDWLRGALFNWAHDLLFSTHHDYIDNSAVAKLWNQHQSGHDFSHILWTILMFRAWQNTY